MSRCVFGVGFSLVCYVYSCAVVCFEPHSLLVVCTRDPLLGQCLMFYFETTPPVSTPTFFDCFRGLRSFHVRFLPSRLTRFQAVPHLHGHYLLWIM